MWKPDKHKHTNSHAHKYGRVYISSETLYFWCWLSKQMWSQTYGGRATSASVKVRFLGWCSPWRRGLVSSGVSILPLHHAAGFLSAHSGAAHKATLYTWGYLCTRRVLWEGKKMQYFLCSDCFFFFITVHQNVKIQFTGAKKHQDGVDIFQHWFSWYKLFIANTVRSNYFFERRISKYTCCCVLVSNHANDTNKQQKKRN